MAETAKSLFDAGDQAFKRGQWKAALAAFAGVAASTPDHFRTRLRIADCLLNIGRQDEALEVYKSVAWHAIKAGYPLLALIAVKMVLLLEPGFEDILVILAESYSRDGDRVDHSMSVAQPPELSDDVVAKEPKLTGDALVAEAVAVACRGDVAHPPARVPSIPLFSHLDEEAFIRVLEKLRLRRYADEESIVRQGARGDSFFIVADGDVHVKRDMEESDGVTLAHLHRGAVFGEMALISDEPRSASVVAQGEVDVLEMKRSDLIVAASQLAGVTTALKQFTRERFLGNLTATHPLFSALSRGERHQVMERFNPVEFEPGEHLIDEGEAGPGLYLLLGGTAEVSKASGRENVRLATLRGADLCGEMSLVGSAPTNATVVAQDKVEALFLPREAFTQIVQAHPEIMRYLAGLTDERTRQNRALLNGRGLFEDDEHIMI